MIGSLIGLIKEKKPSLLLLEVNGVGYEINVPLSTSFQLPKNGESAYLLTHLIVREDQHTLYGFATEEERNLFRTLIKISGVGAKMALTILSGINVNGFVQSVINEDIDTLVHLPGIGKKTAEEVVAAFGEKVFEVFETSPQLVKEASPRRSEKLLDGWKADITRRRKVEINGKDSD